MQIMRMLKRTTKTFIYSLFYYLSCIPLPFPFRLPWGDWWLSWGSQIDQLLKTSSFEKSELALIQTLIKPGMTVIDAGANRGVYSLLMSSLIGATGKVISFEPSLRERIWLRLHAFVNRRKNIVIEEFALGVEIHTAEFFVTLGPQSGLNSLKYPKGALFNLPVRVPVTTLDLFGKAAGWKPIDFIKLDIEGGERDALLGARTILEKDRPLIFCELSNLRTARWQYHPVEIVRFLEAMRYGCYVIRSDDRMAAHREQAVYEDNLLAVPIEKLGQFHSLLPK